MRRKNTFWFIIFVGAMICAPLLIENAAAQVRVDLTFKRKLYVRYEPLIASVTIANMSGRPLLLEDSGHNHWFGFSIETADGRIVPPNNINYSMPPAAIAPGEKLTRAINITPLFPLYEFGAYRVKATVFVSEFDKYFSSPPLGIEITEGRQIWQEVVGVPGESGPPDLRTVSLLSHRLARTTRLYVRIEDKERGKIYATHQLGPFLTFGRPEVKFDVQNNIHILQNSAPKQFVYTHLNLDGEVLTRQNYQEMGTKPTLQKAADGSVIVAGGRAVVPGEAEAAAAAEDKLGDKPAPLPE